MYTYMYIYVLDINVRTRDIVCTTRQRPPCAVLCAPYGSHVGGFSGSSEVEHAEDNDDDDEFMVVLGCVPKLCAWNLSGSQHHLIKERHACAARRFNR